MKKRRRFRYKRFVLFLIFVGFMIGGVFYGGNVFREHFVFKSGYIGSSSSCVILYNDTFEEVGEVFRGEEVSFYGNVGSSEYCEVVYDKKSYYVKCENLVLDKSDVVYNKNMYVRTSATVYKDFDSSSILGFVKKGEEITIVGFDKLVDGVVNRYKVLYNDDVGYIYSKYLVDDFDSSLLPYDQDGSYLVHANRGNTWGGGDASSLDFYPVSKPRFSNNVMPSEVRSLYLNATSIKNVDDYISFALDSNMNAFVVDIKDNTVPGYASLVMKNYSLTNYEKSVNSFEDYKKAISKLKEHGFYVIGRITVFKDSYYVKDHPESAIVSTVDSKPYLHNGSYWPSAYHRDVWEFNVELAKEAVKEMGFHEIQFDYVRFPDRTYQLEKNGEIDLKNVYDESKAQAIQSFLMYACDEIHELGAYVSADVFGESAHTYVTGYGQYWGAISNVVDVISPMPYPDHFGAYEYGFDEIVWTIPYDVLNTWGSRYVSKRQSEIPTPAIVRTWIQAYDAVREPRVIYDSDMVSKEIQGLYDAGLNGGYITWNSSSSLTKYRALKEAFVKEY